MITLRRICVVTLGVSLVNLGCTPSIDQKKYESLHRAARAVDGATSISVNYLKFVELLQTYATELSIADGKATSEAERLMITDYRNALEAYKASADLWNHKIEMRSDEEEIWAGQIPISGEVGGKPLIGGLKREALCKKYGLPIERHDLGSAYWNGVPGDSIQRLWKVAEGHLARATKAFEGK